MAVALGRQMKPPAVVLNEPNCYHFRPLDPPPGYKTAWILVRVTVRFSLGAPSLRD